MSASTFRGFDTSTAPGDEFPSHSVGGAKYPVSKLAFGDADTATPVTSAAPLPVTASGTVELGATSLAALETTELGATTLAALENITVTVSGTVQVADGSGPLTIDGTVELGATSLAALENITVTGPLTDTQLRASAVPVSVGPVTSGGLTAHRATMAATINATNAKGSAGQLYTLDYQNLDTVNHFIKLYNKATPVPAPAADSALILEQYMCYPGQHLRLEWAAGLAFSTGISYAVTGAIADTNTTAIALSGGLMNLGYK